MCDPSYDETFCGQVEYFHDYTMATIISPFGVELAQECYAEKRIELVAPESGYLIQSFDPIAGLISVTATD